MLCACGCPCGGRGTHWGVFLCCCLWSLRLGLSLSLVLADWLDWLTSKPLGSFCLHLRLRVHYHMWGFYRAPGDLNWAPCIAISLPSHLAPHPTPFFLTAVWYSTIMDTPRIVCLFSWWTYSCYFFILFLAIITNINHYEPTLHKFLCTLTFNSPNNEETLPSGW